MNKNHNCLITKIDERDYIKGDGNIPLRANLLSADWTQYFHFNELQKIGAYETDCCVIFSAQETCDAMMDYLIATGKVPQATIALFTQMGYMDSNSDDKKPHFHTSPRYWATLTGNLQNGNALQDPWDMARKYGCIPWSDRPVDATTIEPQIFFAPIPQELLDKGQQFLAAVGKNWVQYHWVSKNGGVGFKDMDIDRVQAPLCIGIAVTDGWNQVEPTLPVAGAGPAHSVANYAKATDGEKILDHYVPYDKVLVNGYPIPQILQAVITVNPPPPVPPSAPINVSSPQSISQWSQWLTAVSSWLRSLLDPGSLGAARSPKWPEVEKAFLKLNPNCKVCGTEKDRQVHHVQVFHLHPDQELNPANLITLCRPHHFLFGHFMNWSSFNKDVRTDSALWNTKISQRP